MVRCEPLMHNARVVRRARREADARPARSRLLFRTAVLSVDEEECGYDERDHHHGEPHGHPRPSSIST